MALPEAPSDKHRIELCQECRQVAWCINFGGTGFYFLCDACDAMLDAEEASELMQGEPPAGWPED